MADEKTEELSEKPKVGSAAEGIDPSSGAPAATPTNTAQATGSEAGLAPSRTSSAQHGVTREAGDDDEAPPPKPPRPVSPRHQAEETLKDAFPSIDAAVIRAVLVASGGKVEPAFNALLSMSDPTAQEEPTPPPQPPRPNRPPQVPDATTTTPRDQLEADELYARQLAQHYGETVARRADTTSRGDRMYPSSTARQRETGLKPSELDEDDHSFFDDDLPVIKENIRKTFFETQSKVNRWVTDLRKKIDGDESDEMSGTPSQSYGAGSYQQGYGARRSAESGRRSGERDRYDADPQVLGDDFGALELKDDDAHHPRSSRPLANPNLFKPTSTNPGTGSRKVSFQAGPPAEIGVTPSSQQPERRPSPAGKNSKWEPLKAVEPSPMADNDPFSLGDSDDERDAKTSSTTTTTAIPKDGDDGDADRLQKASAAAMAESIGKSPKAGVGSGGKPDS